MSFRAELRIMETIFTTLGAQLLAVRKRRRLSQPDLAKRLGRDRARISELERDLASNRLGRDRLTLFAEMCDALDLVPVLVPRSRAEEVRHLIGDIRESRHTTQVPSAFDELFVDLDEDEAR
jgi:transcriptional regulator with XRE-family HTH domain